MGKVVPLPKQQSKKPQALEDWQKIASLLMKAEIDQVVTYQEMSQAIGRNILLNRDPYYRALQEIRASGLRTFECVRNVGYRRVHPREHVRLGDQHSRRAKHELRTAEETLQTADRNHLTPHEAKVTEAHLIVVQSTQLALRNAESKREKELERLAAEEKARQERLNAPTSPETAQRLLAKFG